MALVGTIVVGSLGLALALQWHTGRLDALMRMQAALPTPVAAAAAPASAALSASQRELDRLRALEQQQQRVRALLASGIAGTPEGYTPYLKALSRQAQGSLWITGFSVTAEGNAIELEGRMTDPSVLPAYLRKLNAEQRFQGRPFAQLQIRTLDGSADGGAGHSEFALRSAPETRAAAK